MHVRTYLPRVYLLIHIICRLRKSYILLILFFVFLPGIIWFGDTRTCVTGWCAAAINSTVALRKGIMVLS